MRGCGVWFGVELSDEDMLIVCASGDDGGVAKLKFCCVRNRDGTLGAWGSKEDGSWCG
jgi:hypothetical protein